MAIPNYQDIIDLLKNGLTLEAREKILELREAALKLQEENLSLKEKLGPLHSQVQLGHERFHSDAQLCSEMYFDKGVYWLRTPTDDGTNLLGPYCQVCHDRDNKPVRLHRTNAPGGGWYCAVCRNQF
jgi:hypothetical protein